jgi:hypothetical protein
LKPVQVVGGITSFKNYIDRFFGTDNLCCGNRRDVENHCQKKGSEVISIR